MLFAMVISYLVIVILLITPALSGSMPRTIVMQQAMSWKKITAICVNVNSLPVEGRTTAVVAAGALCGVVRNNHNVSAYVLELAYDVILSRLRSFPSER